MSKREYMRQWRAENKERLRRYEADRYWSDPDKARDRTRRNREKNPALFNSRTAAWRVANPDKIKDYTQRYYWADPEASRKRARDWAEARPEDVRKSRRDSARRNEETGRKNANLRRGRKRDADGHYAIEDARLILRLQGNRCAYCEAKDDLHLDHAIPLARGGSNWPWNLQYLCARHNISKGCRTDAEYRALIGLPPGDPPLLALYKAALVLA